MILKKYAILWHLTLVSIVVYAQESHKVISTITVEPISTTMVTITGLCTNNSSQTKELKYVLSVQQRTQSGNANNNNQSGNLHLDSEESKTLSTTTLNFRPEDHIEIVLTIFDAKQVQIAQHKKLITKSDLLKN